MSSLFQKLKLEVRGRAIACNPRGIAVLPHSDHTDKYTLNNPNNVFYLFLLTLISRYSIEHRLVTDRRKTDILH